MGVVTWVSFGLSVLSLIVLPILFYWVGLFIEAFQFSAEYSHTFRGVLVLWMLPSLLHLVSFLKRAHSTNSYRKALTWSARTSLVVNAVLITRGYMVESQFLAVPVVHALYVFYLIRDETRKSVD